MTVVSQAREFPSRKRLREPRGFRTDIQALRALAVGLVILYHLWPNRLVGGFIGVDVFFVVSGFLITSHLLKTPPRSAGDVVQFWGRRVRRLLPASLLVLLCTAVASYIWAPASQWANTASHIISSALYVENWNLAINSVDYLAADNAPSPVQHFWSLSVEEQFYFVWPVLIGVLVWLASRSRLRFTVVAGIAAVCGASLAYGVYLTAAEPAAAYFVTPARLWELAAGGLVAVLAMNPRFKLGVAPAGVLAWVGLAGIALTGLLLHSSVPFPGWIAVVPVVSTALVLVANATSKWAPGTVLAVAPVQFLGNISYGAYLWHWPLLVILPAVSGNLGLLDKLTILALTILLAWLSTRFVEPYFQRSQAWRSNARTFGFALLAMAVVVGSGIGLGAAADQAKRSSESAVQAAQQDAGACFGAGALPGAHDVDAACTLQGDKLLLSPVAAKTDKSDAYKDGCWSSGTFEKRPACTYGDGKTRVALVGNSHAGHWLPALQALAQERGWTITTFLIDRCNATTTVPLAFDTPEKAQGCADYAKYVQERTTSGDFDAVITSQRQSLPLKGYTEKWEGNATAATQASVEADQLRMLEAWKQAGLKTMVIRDTPYPAASVPDCVAAHAADTSACEATVKQWHWLDPLADAARTSGTADVLDPTDWICPDGICRPVIGGVITYFDGSHLTATYAKSLAPLMGRWLDEHPDLGL